MCRRSQSNNGNGNTERTSKPGAPSKQPWWVVNGDRSFLHGTCVCILQELQPEAEDEISNQAQQIMESTALQLCQITNSFRVPYHSVPYGKFLTGKSCHSNTEKCTRMTKCRHNASRYWQQARFCPFVSEDTFLSLCTGDKKINRALFHRKTVSNQRSEMETKGLVV